MGRACRSACICACNAPINSDNAPIYTCIALCLCRQHLTFVAGVAAERWSARAEKRCASQASGSMPSQVVSVLTSSRGGDAGCLACAARRVHCQPLSP
eukprot:1630032-Rhodomonas_salina.1